MSLPGQTAPSFSNGASIRVGGSEYRILKRLGEGGFAFVYLVENSMSGETLVLKRMHVRSHEVRGMAQMEVQLHSTVRHQSIVAYKGHGAQGNEVYILMECCAGGNLFEKLQAAPGHRLPNEQVKRVFETAVAALAVLHTRDPPVAHRDVKPENVLFRHEFGDDCCLCDFGSCAVMPVPLQDGSQRSVANESIERSTTQMYRAPEMVDLYREPQLTVATDIWALACLLYVMLIGRQPFEEGSNLAILNAQMRADALLPLLQGRDPRYAELLERMFDSDPETRAEIREVIACCKAMRDPGEPLPPRLRQPRPRRTEEEELAIARAAQRSRRGQRGRVQQRASKPLKISSNSVAARRLAERRGDGYRAPEPEQQEEIFRSGTPSKPRDSVPLSALEEAPAPAGGAFDTDFAADFDGAFGRPSSEGTQAFAAFTEPSPDFVPAEEGGFAAFSDDVPAVSAAAFDAFQESPAPAAPAFDAFAPAADEAPNLLDAGAAGGDALAPPPPDDAQLLPDLFASARSGSASSASARGSDAFGSSRASAPADVFGGGGATLAPAPMAAAPQTGTGAVPPARMYSSGGAMMGGQGSAPAAQPAMDMPMRASFPAAQGFASAPGGTAAVAMMGAPQQQGMMGVPPQQGYMSMPPPQQAGMVGRPQQPQPSSLDQLRWN